MRADVAILCHFFATFVTSCTYRNEVQYLDTNDNKFDTDFTKDIFNWDQSLAIFGFSKPTMILNNKGEICYPDIQDFSPFDYGSGVGTAVSNQGLLVCGGEKNKYGGENDPRTGGNCCLWFQKGRRCLTILPWEKNEDKLGFTDFNGHLIMATDLNRAIHQSFIFAFGQGSGEVAVGYFDRLRKGLKQMTKLKWFWKADDLKQLSSEEQQELVPIKDPCVLVHNYKVFLIGGINQNNKTLTGTWSINFKQLLPDQIPTTTTLNAPWVNIPNFPSQARSGSACFVDEKNTLNVIGGHSHMGHRNLKSIERIKIDDLLKKDLTKSENYEALTAELKHPKVAQLFDDQGGNKSTFVIGIKDKDLWVEKLMTEKDGKMVFNGREPSLAYEDMKTPDNLDLSMMTSGILPGISFPECQDKFQLPEGEYIILTDADRSKQLSKITF